MILVIYFPGNKAELLKIKNEYVQSCSGKNGEFNNSDDMRDAGHNKSGGETSDGEIEEIQKTNKNQQEHTESKKEKRKMQVQNKDNQLSGLKKKKKKIANRQTKQEEQRKKKEEKEQKKQEMLKRSEEKKKKKEEQQRKKEERQLKKKEQEQKKEENQKRKQEQEKTKELLLQRNQSIMQQMADFEELETWEVDSTSQPEPQCDNFTTDVVDESVSLISSCQQIMKPHPTTGKKVPRKQFMSNPLVLQVGDSARNKFNVTEGPYAKRLTPASATATNTGSYPQVSTARKSLLPEVCNNCTVLLKELEDARYQIQSLKQNLEGTVY